MRLVLAILIVIAGMWATILLGQDNPGLTVIQHTAALNDKYGPVTTYTRLELRMDPWSDPIYRLNVRGEVYVGEKILITENGDVNGTPAEVHAALTALAEDVRAISPSPFPKESVNRWSLTWVTPLNREDTK